MPVSLQVIGIHSLLHNWLFVMVSGEQWLFSRDHDGGGLVTKSSSTLCNPMDHSPPSSSVHGTSHSRKLVWVAISSSRGSSQPRDQTWVSCIADGLLICKWILNQLSPQGSPTQESMGSTKWHNQVRSTRGHWHPGKGDVSTAWAWLGTCTILGPQLHSPLTTLLHWSILRSISSCRGIKGHMSLLDTQVLGTAGKTSDPGCRGRQEGQCISGQHWVTCAYGKGCSQAELWLRMSRGKRAEWKWEWAQVPAAGIPALAAVTCPPQDSSNPLPHPPSQLDHFFSIC